jgi:iron complex outermembrane receptor protein
MLLVPAFAQKPPEPAAVEEKITVYATRNDQRLQDSPLRVEVLSEEEIQEKTMMTPGDIVMLLNETGGLRVQTTSPALGGASVRVQGMRGRYTRFLSDGLPLFGQQGGGLGLLQIPPMDLGQVEVIKGVSSALYGAGAMGGVINLISRRPEAEPVHEFMINRSTLGTTDGVAFLAGQLTPHWSGSLLGGAHFQERRDFDKDTWADLAAYQRGVFHPRLYWDDGRGRNALITGGITYENRTGGAANHVESLDTRRYDIGATAQSPIGNLTAAVRASASWQNHAHRFGATLLRDRHQLWFGEATLRGSAGRHLWVAGTAVEVERYTPREVPRFRYTYTTPGVFVQDDFNVAAWISLSASLRADFHSHYGSFLSPRVSALLRFKGWTARMGVAQGFFAPTPLTEETEAAGLARLTVPSALRAERGRSASFDLTRRFGPLSATWTLFGSSVRNPLHVERDTVYALTNLAAPTTNVGTELLATFRKAPFSATFNYTFVRAREKPANRAADVPLTPRHSFGIVGMWEKEDVGRIGVECYYTGQQRLEQNPYRDASRPYVLLGLLAERVIGPFRLYINAENLTNIRQTRWDPLLRPAPTADGRPTVDAWAPLDGRGINGGVRMRF